MRTFIAIDLSEEIRENVRRIQMKFAGHKLVDPELVHITVKFLGEVTDVSTIIEALRNISHEPFDLEIKGLGVFPSLSYIRVIWVGTNGGEEVEKLHGKVESALLSLGFAKDKKFTAHATIARVKKISKAEKASLVDEVKNAAEVEFGKMRVDELKLKKSTLTPEGPIYEDLYVHPL